MQLEIVVPGKPQTQGSMRHVGAGRMIHRPELVAWRERVRTMVLQEAHACQFPWRFAGPVAVKAQFALPKPARSKYGAIPYGKPDLDKLMRAVGDALAPRSEIGLLLDDGQIVSWNGSKIWAERDPWAAITIKAIAN